MEELALAMEVAEKNVLDVQTTTHSQPLQVDTLHKATTCKTFTAIPNATVVVVPSFIRIVNSKDCTCYYCHKKGQIANSLVPRLSRPMAKNSLVTWANIPGAVTFITEKTK